MLSITGRQGSPSRCSSSVANSRGLPSVEPWMLRCPQYTSATATCAKSPAVSPKLTSVPPGRMARRMPSHASPPAESMATSTPPPVGRADRLVPVRVAPVGAADRAERDAARELLLARRRDVDAGAERGRDLDRERPRAGGRSGHEHRRALAHAAARDQPAPRREPGDADAGGLGERQVRGLREHALLRHRRPARRTRPGAGCRRSRSRSVGASSRSPQPSAG